MDVLVTAEQREAHLALNNPSIAAELSLKRSGRRQWRARLLSRQIKPVLITPDSCLTNHTCSRCLEALQKDEGGPCICRLERETLTLILLQVQIWMVKAVFVRLFVHWMNVCLSGWQMCSYLCSRSEKSGVFKQQGWQMTTFSPVITAKVWRCCNICFHHSKWIFKAAASSILTCSNQSF